MTERKRFAPLLIITTLLIVSMLAAACGGSAVAQAGDTVKVEYTGTLDDGTEFDSSINESFGHPDPLEFTIGEGQLLVAFEEAVIGLKVGESTTVTIPAEEAYGLWSEDNIIMLNWSQMGEGVEPEIGDTLYMQNPYGQWMELLVLNTSEEGVQVDANHKLAGEDLTFEILLVEILPPAE